jgi:hypothetical protein
MLITGRRVFGLMAVLAVVATICVAAGRPPQGKSIDVLFIGNSYTFVNDMPSMLEQLSASAHDANPIHCTMAVAGGATLENHWNNPETRKLLKSRKWAAVVLQEQSMLPIGNAVMFRLYGGLLADEVKSSGSTPVFYMTWARKSNPENQGILTGEYRSVASEHSSVVAPVGEAWRAVWNSRPDLELFAADGSHPSPAGTYLTACVFYVVITGKQPLGLPCPSNVAANDARYLQKAAFETVRREAPSAKTQTKTRTKSRR